MRKLYIIVFLLTLFSVQTLRAQSYSLPRSGFFCYVPYGRSLLADVHPNFARIDIAGFSNHTAYDYSQNNKPWRMSVFGVMGMEAPIWRGEFLQNRLGVSFSITASSTIWLDILEPTTAPVVNTDYRFGMPTTTFIHRLNKGFLRNYSIAFSPYKHESTHIGDELQIQHMEQGYKLRRVNVSYNYAELAFTVNEPEDSWASCHTFRLSAAVLYNLSRRGYNVTPADGPDQLLSQPTAPVEVWLQYQYQTKATQGGLQGIASVEIRNRALYGYTYNGIGLQEERRIFTYNAFIGLRYNSPGYDGYFSRFALGLRGYYGNCPYGQFRNLPNFAQVGISLIFQ